VASEGGRKEEMGLRGPGKSAIFAGESWGAWGGAFVLKKTLSLLPPPHPCRGFLGNRGHAPRGGKAQGKGKKKPKKGGGRGGGRGITQTGREPPRGGGRGPGRGGFVKKVFREAGIKNSRFFCPGNQRAGLKTNRRGGATRKGTARGTPVGFSCKKTFQGPQGRTPSKIGANFFGNESRGGRAAMNNFFVDENRFNRGVGGGTGIRQAGA